MKNKILLSALLVSLITISANAADGNQAQEETKTNTEASASSEAQTGEDIQNIEPAAGEMEVELEEERTNKLFERRTRGIHNVN